MLWTDPDAVPIENPGCGIDNLLTLKISGIAAIIGPKWDFALLRLGHDPRYCIRRNAVQSAIWKGNPMNSSYSLPNRVNVVQNRLLVPFVLLSFVLLAFVQFAGAHTALPAAYSNMRFEPRRWFALWIREMVNEVTANSFLLYPSNELIFTALIIHWDQYQIEIVDLINDPYQNALVLNAPLQKHLAIFQILYSHSIEPIFPTFMKIAFNADRTYLGELIHLVTLWFGKWNIGSRDGNSGNSLFVSTWKQKWNKLAQRKHQENQSKRLLRLRWKNEGQYDQSSCQG
jgi:hypothetical protein